MACCVNTPCGVFEVSSLVGACEDRVGNPRDLEGAVMAVVECVPGVFSGDFGARMVLRYRRAGVVGVGEEPLSDAVGVVVESTGAGDLVFLPDAGEVLQVAAGQVVSLTPAGPLRLPPVAKAGRMRVSRRLRFAAEGAQYRVGGWWVLPLSAVDARWLRPAGVESWPVSGVWWRELASGFELPEQQWHQLQTVTSSSLIALRVGHAHSDAFERLSTLEEHYEATLGLVLGFDDVSAPSGWFGWVNSPWHVHLMIR